jgi:membrane protein YfhO
VALVYADLWLAGRAWNPALPPATALPDAPPSLRAVAAPPGRSRVAGIGAVLPPNTGVYAGLEDIRGYDVPVLDSFHRYFTELLGGRGEWWIYDLPVLSAQALPAFSAANVRWFLTQDEAPPPLELAYDGEVRVYRNPNAFPRAFVVGRAEAVADGAAARARVRELGDRLREVVVLEAPPNAVPAGDAAPEGPAGVVRIASYAPRRVVIEADARAGGWLVLADSAYPGWQARVDGADTPIFRANALFRAIRLPGGAHRVEFVYNPWSARIGGGLSLASIGICLWLFARTRTGSSS